LVDLRLNEGRIIYGGKIPSMKKRKLGKSGLNQVGTAKAGDRVIEIYDQVTKGGTWMFYALIKQVQPELALVMPDELLEMRLIKLAPKYVKALLADGVPPKLLVAKKDHQPSGTK